MHFLCFVSDINVWRKLFENWGITFNITPALLISASVELISDHLFHAYWLKYFVRAEGVPKAIRNTLKFVVFIGFCLILGFTSSSACRYAHKMIISVMDMLVVNAALSTRKGSKMGDSALNLYK